MAEVFKVDMAVVLRVATLVAVRAGRVSTLAGVRVAMLVVARVLKGGILAVVRPGTVVVVMGDMVVLHKVAMGAPRKVAMGALHKVAMGVLCKVATAVLIMVALMWATAVLCKTVMEVPLKVAMGPQMGMAVTAAKMPQQGRSQHRVAMVAPFRVATGALFKGAMLANHPLRVVTEALHTAATVPATAAMRVLQELATAVLPLVAMAMAHPADMVVPCRAVTEALSTRVAMGVPLPATGLALLVMVPLVADTPLQRHQGVMGAAMASLPRGRRVAQVHPVRPSVARARTGCLLGAGRAVGTRPTEPHL